MIYSKATSIISHKKAYVNSFFGLFFTNFQKFSTGFLWLWEAARNLAIFWQLDVIDKNRKMRDFDLTKNVFRTIGPWLMNCQNVIVMQVLCGLARFCV